LFLSDVSAATGAFLPGKNLLLKDCYYVEHEAANVVSLMELGVLDQLICEATDEIMQLKSWVCLASARKFSGKTCN
jgi:hypothetical protein